MKILRLTQFFVILLIMTLLACQQTDSSHSAASSSDGRVINITTTTPMIADWVKQVGGEHVNVQSIIPPSTDPHTFQPGAKDIASITDSNYVFAIGLSYEGLWLTKLLDNHPNIQVVNLGELVSPIAFDSHGDHEDEDSHGDHEDEDSHGDHEDEDSHGDHESHEHALYDPHFWFDPLRVSSAVLKISDVLSVADSVNASFYKGRAEVYLDKLEALDKNIFRDLSNIPESKRNILTEHESLGYLGERYEIGILRAVIPNFTSDSGPRPKDLVNAIELIRSRDVSVIFMEKETNDKSAEKLADETGIRVANGLSVETLEIGQTYVDFMKYNIDVIVSNLDN